MRARPLLIVCGCHGGGRGEKQWYLLLSGTQPPPSTPLLAPCAPILTPHSPRIPQPGLAFLHPWWRGSLVPPDCTSLLLLSRRPTSTGPRRPPSARRSRIVSRYFLLPVSFSTPAHRIFCWPFHSGYTLKRCSRVCIWHRHHQN